MSRIALNLMVVLSMLLQSISLPHLMRSSGPESLEDKVDTARQAESTPTQPTTPTTTPTPTTTASFATDTQTPTATFTPTIPDTSPTPTATWTPTPTSSPTVTSTPTLVVNTANMTLSLTLEAADPSIEPGGSILITWKIEPTTEEKIPGSLSLSFIVPGYFQPPEEYVKSFDPEQGLLRFPITELKGEIQWYVLPEAEGPFTLSAQVIHEEAILASTDLQLQDKTLFSMNTLGGEISTFDGDLTVQFPPNSLRDTTEIRIRRWLPSDQIPASLSGQPFELLARDPSNKTNTQEFDAPVTIQLHYQEEDLRGDEASLTLYYFDEAWKDWFPLPSSVDSEANLLTATTTHFSIFDFDSQNWDAARLPSVAAFQVAPYTGAATFSMNLQVPPGPGGLQPNLTLSYYSQAVDSASSTTQASWVGMGWSLDTGHIQRNTNGTPDYPGDDTFSLSVSGMSNLLLPIPDADGDPDTTDYKTAEDSFWRIRHYISWDGILDTSYWVVWDKTGTQYTFDDGVFYLEYDGCSISAKRIWKWPLSRVKNKDGIELVFQYETEDKVTKKCEVGGQANHNVAVYPATILYPHNRYRIRFERTSRSDFRAPWLQDLQSRVLFERSLLSTVWVEHDADGDQVYEQVIRKYVFTYATESSDHIFPNHVWSAGGRTPTLIQVQEFGLGGTNALPPHIFEYADGMHLSHGENGYGGAVEFSYISWNDVANHEDATEEKAYSPPIDISEPTEITALNKTVFFPGAAYELRAVMYASESHWVKLGFDYGSGTVWSDPIQGQGASSNWQAFEAIVALPALASKAMPLIDSNGANLGTSYFLTVLPTRNRVAEKQIYDGIDPAPDTFGYDYTGAAMNDPDHSDGVSTAYPYVKEYSEFRGHEEVAETGPDGSVSITWFYQDDIYKGRSYLSEIRSSGQLLYQKVETTYDSTTQTAGDLPKDEGGHTFTDLAIRWIYPTQAITKAYEGGSSWEGIRQQFEYQVNRQGGEQYGNTTEVLESSWNGSSWDLYRSQRTEFYPNDSGNTYLVSLPARMTTHDSSGALLSETRLHYDGAPGYTTPPSTGSLTASRILIDSPGGVDRYSDTTFGHDAWGNPTSVTVFTAYGTDSTLASEGAQTTATTFDSVYHTYALSTTNELAHSISWEYDFAMGLPTQETDPNGSVTTAGYDDFGRLEIIRRPGDETGTPSLEIVYDDATPYGVEIRQKLEGTTVSRTRRYYDGAGRLIQTQIAGAVLDSGTFDVLVDTFYDGVGRVSQQTVPYNVAVGSGYRPRQAGQPSTHTLYDILGRPKTITSPDTTQTTYLYDLLEVARTDARSNTTTTYSDVWGRVIQVVPPLNPTATYDYDELDRLQEVASAGEVTSIEYDLAGRKISLDDPDMGFWSYSYDALGNLEEQTDARGCTTSLDYDDLNRLGLKSYAGLAACGETDSVTYDYDDTTGGNHGIGRRTSMSDGTGSTTWTYDDRGRVSEEANTITGVGSFLTQWGYNAADQPVWMRYPDGPGGQSGEQVDFDYLPQGALYSVIGTDAYVGGLSYDAAGRIVSRVLGTNLLEQSFTYYPWTSSGGRLQELISERQSDSQVLQHLEYAYDAVGNIDWIKDWIAGSPQQQTFSYDDLDRLLTAEVTGGTVGLYSETYQYNPTTGNLAAKGGITYAYLGALPHAVTHLDGQPQYEYDANGNMVERYGDTFDSTLTYDAENRLVAGEAPPEPPGEQPTLVELTPISDVTIGAYDDQALVIPVGTVAIFTTNCPSGWERFTELDGRFPRGAPVYGVTGGSETHSHTYTDVPQHLHGAGTLQAAASGLHTHTLWFHGAIGGSAPYVGGGQYAGSWIEGVVSTEGDHNHGAAGLTAMTGVPAPQTDPATSLPPYLEVVFCRKVVSDQESLPQGAVLIFDASLPQGWTHFSPLDDRFPRGAASYGETGGSEVHEHTYTEVPEHSHAAGDLVTSTDGAHTHSLRFRSVISGSSPYVGGGSPPGYWYSNNVSTAGGHSHDLVGNTSATGVLTPGTGVSSHLPSYLNVVFGQKTITDGIGIPFGAISLFSGSSCPDGWERVNEFDGRFLFGAETYGAAGGSDTHIHTYADVPEHSHEAGSLQTTTDGAHSHSLWFKEKTRGSSPYVGGGMNPGSWYGNNVSTAGEHTHTVSGEVALEGTTTPETETAYNLPPYMNLLVCKNTGYGEGSDDALHVGNDGAAELTYRSLLRWDLSSIPPNAIVEQAEIVLSVSEDHSENERTLQAYRLKLDWDEYSTTWSLPWSVPGASGDQDRDQVQAGSGVQPANPGTSVTITLDPPRIQEMIQGAWIDFGFILVVDIEDSDLVIYHARESGQSALRPTLRVWYTIPESTQIEFTPILDANIGVYEGGEHIVPVGTVAIFATNCPSGWERFTEMDGRFPRGAPVYGGSGGSDTHTHTYTDVPQHSHGAGTLQADVSTEHTHTLWFHGAIGGSAPYIGGGQYAGSWIGGVVSTDGDHNHGVTGLTAVTGVPIPATDPGMSLPPYLEVIFCRKAISDEESLPQGAVLIFDASLPQDWTQFSALDNRFPRGAATYGATGGSDIHDHTYSEIPEHTHAAGDYQTSTDGAHTHSLRFRSVISGSFPYVGGTSNPGSWYENIVSTEGDHSHNITGDTSATSLPNPATTASSHLPSYLDVVFGQKTVTDEIGIPFGAIILFSGSSCPEGWERISDLDGRFLYGAGSYGASGGSDTHIHNYADVPQHSHGAGSLGTTTDGAHSHSLWFFSTAGGSDPYVSGGMNPGSWYGNNVSSAGSHSHSVTGSSASEGVVDPQTDPGSSLPPYLDLLVCKNAATWQGFGEGTGSTLSIGNQDALNPTSRTLVQWDLSSLPPDAVILGAEIELQVESDLSSNTRILRAYRLKKAWEEGSVTWSYPWTEPGAEGSEDRDPALAGYGEQPADPGASVSFPVDPAMVEAMLHGTWTDHGFILEVEVEEEDLVQYHSREASPVELRPILRVWYGAPTHRFFYDGNGDLVKSVVDGVTTVYIGGHYEYEVETGVARSYYFAGGSRVALREAGELFFLLGDHLGSTAITTDDAGLVVGELRYKAWGELRYESGSPPTDYRYTGQREEAGLGIYYYRARWYDPALGRFAQADTIVPDLGKPMSLDRYAYVYNNPMRYIDPSGHFCVNSNNRIVCSNDTDRDYYYWTQFPDLPDPETISSRESKKSVSRQMRQDTWDAYVDLRNELFLKYSWSYVDATGKIRDEVLMALILAGEVSIFNQETSVYLEAIEALGNQYYDPEFAGSCHCGPGGCTAEQQISWLFTMEFIRNQRQKSDSFSNFQSHLASGELAQSGYHHGTDDSWFWGNVSDEKLNNYSVVLRIKTDSYPGKPWFIIYR